MRIHDLGSDTLWVYTDGACSGNPGPGGWAALLKHPQYNHHICGYDPHTTNNRMELLAVIQGLLKACEVSIASAMIVVSDSQYVVKGMTEWVFVWEKNGWKTSQKKPVENRDLWESLLLVSRQVKKLSWQWVRAHQGHPENEMVNQLAQQAIKNFNQKAFSQQDNL